jgi:hypothetical protein
MTDTLQTVSAMAFGAALTWVVVLLRTFWREYDEPKAETTTPPRRLWRGELRIVHRHTHDLTPETVGLLGEMVDRAVYDYYARQREHTETLPRSRELVTPPEPEERIARDLTRAHAVLRGADQLRAEARARGMDLPPQMAMQEAAKMVSTAFDDPFN